LDFFQEFGETAKHTWHGFTFDQCFDDADSQVRLPNALRSHEQQTYRWCCWKFLDKSFGGDLGYLNLLRRQLLAEIKVLQLTMSIAGRNSRIRNEPVDAGLPEAVAALYAGNAILDEMNPTRPVALRTTW
jgi:hypothetical protein